MAEIEAIATSEHASLVAGTNCGDSRGRAYV